MLKETLRHIHATRLLEQAAHEGDSISARPPELLSLLYNMGDGAVLYPDPPLGGEELALLNETHVTTTTPLSRLAAERPLKETGIALSMSESTDIQRFGFDELHLREAMVELSCYLLLKGATLVYGGHLGDKGYTQILFELVRAHHCLEGVERMERIINTVGWLYPTARICLPNTARLRVSSASPPDRFKCLSGHRDRRRSSAGHRPAGGEGEAGGELGVPAACTQCRGDARPLRAMRPNVVGLS